MSRLSGLRRRLAYAGAAGLASLAPLAFSALPAHAMAAEPKLPLPSIPNLGQFLTISDPPSGQSSGTYSPSGSHGVTICPGSCDQLWTAFQGSIQQEHNVFSDDKSTWSSYSDGEWQGFNPYYPDGILLGDHWGVDTVTGQVTISVPPGITLSADGKGADWSSGWQSGQYYLTHTMDNLQFATHTHFTAYHESSTVDTRFGPNFFTTNAYWDLWQG